MENDFHGGGSVMVWGGYPWMVALIFIPRQGHNDCTKASRRGPGSHCETAVAEGFILMHDNERPRTARIYTAYLDQQGIEVMV